MSEADKILKIKELMRYYGFNIREFADYACMPESSVSKILRGERPCGGSVTSKILLAFDKINPEWFNGESYEMFKPGTVANSGDITITGNQNSSISNVGHGNTYTSPASSAQIHSHTQCKCAIYPMLPDHVVRALDTNVEEWKRQNPDQCKMIDLRELIGQVSHVQKMIGRAMEPNIPEGTLLFLREINAWDEALLDGTIYGVDVARPHMIIRKVYDDGDHIRCQPINPDFDAVRIPKEKVMNLYKISSGWKKFD